MNPRSNVRRWLVCVLLIVWWTQAGVVAVHHPIPGLTGAASSGEGGGGRHDPATCFLCHVISQLRAQSGPASSVSIALPGEAVLLVPGVAVAPPIQPARFRLAPRAPPSSPIA